MSTNVIGTLQGHQLVLSRELEEITADLVVLQGMSSRYLQSDITFTQGLDSLTRLRNEKEQQLSNVIRQIQSMEQSLQQSNALVNDLQRMGNVTQQSAVPLGRGLGAANATQSQSTATYQYVTPANTDRAPTGPPPARPHYSTMLPGTSTQAPMVTLAAPSGLLVSTNSSILTHSPHRGQ